MFVFNNGVRCIAGSARNVGNNHSVFAEHSVDKGGFTHIGLADNGNLYCVIILLGFLSSGKIFQNLVKQIARAVTVNRGNGHRVAQAEIVELVKIRRKLAHSVALIYAENNGLLALSQH